MVVQVDLPGCSSDLRGRAGKPYLSISVARVVGQVHLTECSGEYFSGPRGRAGKPIPSGQVTSVVG